MDWINEIKHFPKFDIRNVNPDIDSKDALKINLKYKKALDNALNDSVDIAIIELRKLSVLYPEAGQISLLLACCQVWDEKAEEALRSFKKVRAASTPLDLESKINEYEQIAKYEAEKMKSKDFISNKPKSLIPSSPAIIEATPNRWKKAKIASDREKREIMRNLNSNQSNPTFIKEDRKFDYFKIIYIFAIIVLIVSVIAIVVFTVPKAIKSIRAYQQDSAEKLEWILTRLSEEQEENPGVKKILEDFDKEFFPLPEPTITKEPTEIAPTSIITPEPTSTPEPTLTTAPTLNDKVKMASILISEANDIGRNDAKKVYELIYEAEKLLEGIDGNIKATGLEISKDDVDTGIENLMSTVVNAACYPFFRDGIYDFRADRYTQAIENFKNAYEIYPGYRDGLNAYNLGRSYELTGMVNEANEMFKFVVENYPGTDVASWAEYRIKEGN